MESGTDNQKEDFSSDEEAQRTLRKEKRKNYYRSKRKKRSKQKKFKRMLETIGWILIILAFAATLIILMIELELIGGKR